MPNGATNPRNALEPKVERTHVAGYYDGQECLNLRRRRTSEPMERLGIGMMNKRQFDTGFDLQQLFVEQMRKTAASDIVGSIST